MFPTGGKLHFQILFHTSLKLANLLPNWIGGRVRGGGGGGLPRGGDGPFCCGHTISLSTRHATDRCISLFVLSQSHNSLAEGRREEALHRADRGLLAGGVASMAAAVGAPLLVLSVLQQVLLLPLQVSKFLIDPTNINYIIIINTSQFLFIAH